MSVDGHSSPSLADTNHFFYDKLKEEHGGFTAIAWIIIGVIRFYIEPSTKFISWQGAAFFAVGLLVMPVILGGAFYLLTRALSQALIRLRIMTAPTVQMARFVKAFGLMLMLIQAALIWLLTKWLVHLMF